MSVETVRALIPDVKKFDWDGSGDEEYILSDDMIEIYLELHENNVLRAAAEAINVIAANEAMVAKKIRTDDLSTDGPAVADALRKRAYELNSRADRIESREANDLFDMSPMIDTRDRYFGVYQ